MTEQEKEELKNYAWWSDFEWGRSSISKIEKVITEEEKRKGTPIPQDYKDVIIEAYSRVYEVEHYRNIKTMVMALLAKNYQEYNPLVLADILNFYLKNKRGLQFDIMRCLFMFDPTMTREEVQQKINIIENDIAEIINDDRVLDLLDLPPKYYIKKQENEEVEVKRKNLKI